MSETDFRFGPYTNSTVAFLHSVTVSHVFGQMMVLFVINSNFGCDKKLYLNLTCGQIPFFAGKVDDNAVSCPNYIIIYRGSFNCSSWFSAANQGHYCMKISIKKDWLIYVFLFGTDKYRVLIKLLITTVLTIFWSHYKVSCYAVLILLRVLLPVFAVE